MKDATLLHLHTYEPIISDGFKRFLATTDASMAVAVGGRLWFFTADADGHAVAMEIGLEDVAATTWHDGRLWVASAWQIWTFADVLATTAEGGGGEHTLLPQSAHTTGSLAVTDLAVARGGIVLVSGLFSCLATLDDRFSMRPIWIPLGLEALRPETRWLITGVALRDEVAAFVTVAGRSNEPEGWKESIHGGGEVMDTAGIVVADGLTVPRHPRWYRNGLIVADSGSGRLLGVDPDIGGTETIATLGGVLGALDIVGDFAVIGHGDPGRASVEGLPGGPVPNDRAQRETLSLIDLTSRSVTGTIEFLGAAGPIQSISVLPGAQRSSIAMPRGLVAQNTVVMAALHPLLSHSS
jgi:uncharacterized protein (TIGR03032 family)